MVRVILFYDANGYTVETEEPYNSLDEALADIITWEVQPDRIEVVELL